MPAIRPIFFYAGLAMVTMATLMLQIVETRILSVTTYYHLAFLSISMAMFGMTAGAVWVYLQPDRFSRETLVFDLARYATGFALTTAAAITLQLALPTVLVPSVASLVAWIELTVILAAPFFFSGVVVALALTRSPFPVGTVYAVDLVGAAAGCLGVLAALELTDAPSVVLGIASAIALGAYCFARSGIGGRPPARRGSALRLASPLPVCVVLAALTVANSVLPYGLSPLVVKGEIQRDHLLLHDEWNSFSRVMAHDMGTPPPQLWQPSPITPRSTMNPVVGLSIDGMAGTTMHRFDGNRDAFGYLQYDLTNLAYFARREGRAAVIGVGGGRDLLSAHVFGFADITAVELNPIFVRLLADPAAFRAFAGLADLPGLRLVVDEGRSWFARSDDRFDLVQMSLIDTWAATGAGAFTLSENGLYTVEAWSTFLRRLKPDGLFTVSRWYSGRDVDETGRTVSLALAALMASGAAAPAQHVFVAAGAHLANIIVSPTPLSPATLDILHAEAARLQFRVLVSPRASPASPVLASILDARSPTELEQLRGRFPLDLSPPSDDRPFFFNQLRIGQAPALVLDWLSGRGAAWRGGVIAGNLHATLTLLMLLAISVGLVLATIVFPLRPSLRRAAPRLAAAGSAYFLCLGVAFMFVEIALLQRLSVFLGHPIYALAIVLFSLILTTGAGSFLSERWPLARPAAIALWAVMLCAYLLLLPRWFDPLAVALNASGIVARAALAFVVILPAGLMMGFGFPTGMRLVNAIDPRPTPWFWGINGAGGVLAATLAVLCSMNLGISATLAAGGLLYLALWPAALMLTARTGRAWRSARSGTAAD